MLVQHLDNQGSIKFFTSELKPHFEPTGHLLVPTLEWTFFSFTVLQMTMQVNWAGETEMKILSNEWILFFVLLF